MGEAGLMGHTAPWQKFTTLHNTLQNSFDGASVGMGLPRHRLFTSLLPTRIYKSTSTNFSVALPTPHLTMQF